MIYATPAPNDPIDQGDLIDHCPVATVTEIEPGFLPSAKVNLDLHRGVVLTQTCDLANQKAEHVIVASVFDVQQLVDQALLKPADVKGPIRAGRVWGLYFLPAQAELGLEEMIVDLRRLHAIRAELLAAACLAGHRLARLQTPYREHLAKHFADTFCRIGLPQPYETM